MTQTQQTQDDFVFGYCLYCKSEVHELEDYKRVGQKLYHRFCYEQKTNYKQGLKFSC